jgi:hypothetical protein
LIARIRVVGRALRLRSLPADFCLLTPGTSGSAGKHLSRARQTVLASSQLRIGAVELLGGASFERSGSGVVGAGARIQRLLARVHRQFAVVERVLPCIGEAFAQISAFLSVVSEAFALVRDPVALVRNGVAGVRPELVHLPRLARSPTDRIVVVGSAYPVMARRSAR